MTRRISFPGVMLALFIAGCSEQEIGHIERVTGKAWDKAQNATSRISAELGVDANDPLGKWEDGGLIRKVQQRLQWDQQLQGSSIKVQIESEEVVLTGNVKDERQRQRAVQLAETTDGVHRVKDTLQIVAE
jgi:osmotically-inducible protein OsmY